MGICTAASAVLLILLGATSPFWSLGSMATVFGFWTRDLEELEDDEDDLEEALLKGGGDEPFSRAVVWARVWGAEPTR